MSVTLESPTMRRASDFLAAAHRSRSMYRGLVAPPSTPEAFQAYVTRCRRASHVGYFVCFQHELVGVININEIVLGAFRSGYLGYYAFAPHAGHGHMAEGLRQVMRRAFREHRLHRLEANIQPINARSRALVERLQFRLEGVSPRYLKIAGRWRDHERWAITMEDWRKSG